MLLLCTALLALAAALPAAFEDACPVAIQLRADEYDLPSQVRPHLVSYGPERISIPRWWPRGYRVLALRPDMPLGTDGPEPVVREHPAKKVLEYHPLSYRFRKPDRLVVNWKDVGELDPFGGFTVFPGIYRLSLTFSVEPLKKKGRQEIPLCTVFSPPFRILQQEDWLRVR